MEDTLELSMDYLEREKLNAQAFSFPPCSHCEGQTEIFWNRAGERIFLKYSEGFVLHNRIMSSMGNSFTWA
jgi:hypothetical protein